MGTSNLDMATVNERLAESLRVLKDYQEKNNNSVIRGQEVLGVTHTKRLLDNGYLQPIIKGWYMSSLPGNEGDTTVWYTSYWHFITEYANYRFGNDWSLTPEQSLAFYSGYYAAPNQVAIRAPKASNNIIQLKYGDTLLDVTAALPTKIETEPQFGLHVYSMAEALLFCSPQYFITNSIEAQTCLESLRDASEIIALASNNGNSTRAARIVGALTAIGRVQMADEIMRMMTRLGYDLRPENPFEEGKEFARDIIQRSPYSVRIQLMWEKMKKQILAIPTPKTSKLDAVSILADIDANYVKDSYHSLSIEGYRVTDELIERVRSGQWNPKAMEQDADAKNALVARGYYQAFQSVRKSVDEVLQGKANAGDVVADQLSDWHFELFEPCIQAGIIQASDLIGYRKHQVYIRGSKHTPLNPDAVVDAMQTFYTLLRQEDNPLVRALLGHFFFVYIHPYMDGNGRTARFIMNAMLATGEYSWTINPVERRDEYMSALETASIEGDISAFARFIFGLVE